MLESELDENDKTTSYILLNVDSIYTIDKNYIFGGNTISFE